jgi:protein TonB
MAAHALLITWLFTYAPTRVARNSVAPLMVQLIEPDRPAPAPPAPRPDVDRSPKPLPVKQVQARPDRETPVLAAAPTASAPVFAVPPEPKPAPAIEVGPAVPAPPAAPTPLVPPSFNASYLDNPAPAYPSLSRRMGEEGRVFLRVYVEASGLASRVDIRTSSGSERLDQAALDAVRRWKFVPARQGDQAVPEYVIVPISFSVKG